MREEFQAPGLQRLLRVDAGQGRPEPAIPQLHRATAVLAFRDRAFEIAVVERMILDLHRQPTLAGVEGRALGHRPGSKHAGELEAEVIVQPPRGVFLHDEAQRPGGACALLRPLGSDVRLKSRLAR